MNILVNASNIGGGGGAQVTDSICQHLKNHLRHFFLVVLSSSLKQTANQISSYGNVKVINYNYPLRDYKSLITGRNVFLDSLVSIYSIDCVLTIFGPMKWRPKCPHVCGFALSQFFMKDSPYIKNLRFCESLAFKKQVLFWSFLFKRSADALFAETQFITNSLKSRYKDKLIETITNNYNQIFDQSEKWVEKPLPPFNGIQLLDVTAFGPHKNVTIALDIARILCDEHHDLQFRFVFTFDESEYPSIPKEYRENFLFVGKVSIYEVPSLYQQCDIEFQPTLLECFTATYPEAMKMKKPIITTDLKFAHSVCGDAALYYESLSAKSAANAIYMLSKDQELAKNLISNGLARLNAFDSSEERTSKAIKLCEKLMHKVSQSVYNTLL